MSESTGLTVHQGTPKSVSHGNAFGDYAGMLDLAAQLVTTGFLPQAVRTPAQALAIILTGQELGLGPMQSLRSIYIVSGKPSLSADLQLALFKKGGGRSRFETLTEERAVLHLTHPNGDEHTETFTMKDAGLAGVTGNPTWKKFPKAMLRSRVITAGLKSVGFEPTTGVYDPEELGVEPEEIVVESGSDVAREGAKPENAPGHAAADGGTTAGVVHGVQPSTGVTHASSAPAPSRDKGGFDLPKREALSQKNIDQLVKKAKAANRDMGEKILLDAVHRATGQRPTSLKSSDWPKMGAIQYNDILEAISATPMPNAVTVEDMVTDLLERLKDTSLDAKVRVSVLAQYEARRDSDTLDEALLHELLGALTTG